MVGEMRPGGGEIALSQVAVGEGDMGMEGSRVGFDGEQGRFYKLVFCVFF